MYFFSHPKVQTLDAWLALATGALVPSAQAPIRAEIEAHYAEALQTHLANGSAESAAHAAALADLGNAKSAARRFRRTYLTQKEAHRLAQYDTFPIKFINIFNRYNPVFLLLFLLRPSKDHHLPQPWLWFLLFLYAGNALFEILTIRSRAGRRPTVAVRRQRELVDLFSALVSTPLYFLLAWGFGAIPTSIMLYVIPVLGLLWVFVIAHLIRRRKKLLTAIETDIPYVPPPARRWPPPLFGTGDGGAA